MKSSPVSMSISNSYYCAKTHVKTNFQLSTKKTKCVIEFKCQRSQQGLLYDQLFNCSVAYVFEKLRNYRNCLKKDTNL